jgi:hypothetical protein
MGKIKNNPFASSLSGKYGDDLVFRQVGNQTFFVRYAPPATAPTEEQQDRRHRFAEATFFAAAAMQNPQASQYYQIMASLQGVKSAYLAAMRDYLTKPEIGQVDAYRYRGAVGDSLVFTPKVPYKIVHLAVQLLSPSGEELEAGDAQPFGLKWRYYATKANPQLPGSRLIVLAHDRQGKEGRLEVGF